ncbi:hypothetical protein BDN71DRAFT_1435354 [Pleurotus eryngii]|uniref:Uncharacterized protein n=1 Tax=Pleurotus eryngii TaxID=5323 RepID=A0A9P6D228_PLEER|nr:hypothetical protein BDN71DRAFT_1435354 [Pleurotus eryngii]
MATSIASARLKDTLQGPHRSWSLGATVSLHALDRCGNERERLFALRKCPKPFRWNLRRPKIRYEMPIELLTILFVLIPCLAHVSPAPICNMRQNHTTCSQSSVTPLASDYRDAAYLLNRSVIQRVKNAIRRRLTSSQLEATLIPNSSCPLLKTAAAYPSPSGDRDQKRTKNSSSRISKHEVSFSTCAMYYSVARTAQSSSSVVISTLPFACRTRAVESTLASPMSASNASPVESLRLGLSWGGRMSRIRRFQIPGPPNQYLMQRDVGRRGGARRLEMTGDGREGGAGWFLFITIINQYPMPLLRYVPASIYTL